MQRFFVNSKKPIRLKNRTNYFSPDTCRTHVTFSSPDSYQFRNIKIEGYESRLYWQFRYCKEHNGQTFFYTLTYNDKALPYYRGQRCFDYLDLRDLLTGGFRKQLLRKYGTTFKYFISAELGDGKGSRGFHNNPHYHVLFFLEDAKSSSCPYVPISPVAFRHLVRLYWQGFDEDYGFKSYKDAKYGIATEGDDLGLVSDYRACVYCAKYVCKDVNLKAFERDLEPVLRAEFEQQYSYLKNEVCFRDLVDTCVKEAINEYRNRYCNKVRISHGVGDYALNFIEDKMNPSVQIPSKTGFKNRPIGMYYYRKLYTDVVYDENHHPMRVLNKLGQEFKANNLFKQIAKKSDSAVANFHTVYNDRQLYDLMLSSDVNTDVNFSFDHFRSLADSLLKDVSLNTITTRYAQFKLVYQDRFFKNNSIGAGQLFQYPDIDVLSDYKRFLVPSYYNVSYSPDFLDSFLDRCLQGWLPYYSHPYFQRFYSLFLVLDLCTDYFFIQSDDKNQKEAEERAETNRFHKLNKLEPILSLIN